MERATEGRWQRWPGREMTTMMPLFGSSRTRVGGRAKMPDFLKTRRPACVLINRSRECQASQKRAVEKRLRKSEAFRCP
jgi:hypothetical protein